MDTLVHHVALTHVEGADLSERPPRYRLSHRPRSGTLHRPLMRRQTQGRPAEGRERADHSATKSVRAQASDGTTPDQYGARVIGRMNLLPRGRTTRRATAIRKSRRWHS